MSFFTTPQSALKQSLLIPVALAGTLVVPGLHAGETNKWT
jgi:hypothetical protein